jgi:hypothetical protein
MPYSKKTTTYFIIGTFYPPGEPISLQFYHRHFLPSGRADLTAPASLQGIRGEGPQPHTLCLASAATSTRE